MILPRLRNRLLLAACSSITVMALVLLSDVMAAPSQTPPSGTYDGLLDTGAQAQTKTGPLTVQNTLTATTYNVSGGTNASQLCLNGDCRNYWPSGSSSTPNLNTVLSNGNYLNGSMYGSNFAVGLGGTWRANWPTAYYSGRGGHAISFSDPWNCGTSICTQQTVCGGGYALCGALTNVWGYTDHYACCAIYFGTN